MPIYEYECAQCGHSLETIQKISDPPLSQCPECNQHSLTKLVSAPSFRLKGQGWYETDFKKDKQRNLVDSKATNNTGDDTKETKKSEDKTEKKSASDNTASASTTTSTATSSSDKPATKG